MTGRSVATVVLVSAVVIVVLAALVSAGGEPRTAEPTEGLDATVAPSIPSIAPRASEIPVTASVPPRAISTGEPLSQLLAELAVAPEHRTGYDRDLFPLWIDADGDGCNTRYEVLIAESVTPPTVTGNCRLDGGTWFSGYDGQTLDDVREVEIDHVVALAEAWYSGSYAWTTERREAFANDLDVPWTLAAASHTSNESKGSDDPAEWIPPRAAAVCPYIAAWINIKTRWGLTIDRAEHAALARLLARCPDDRVVVPPA